MNNNIYLNETAIKQALKDGHITQQEARQMLVVYLQKANFTPMRHPSSHTHHTSPSSHY
jgi:hypothetical protein